MRKKIKGFFKRKRVKVRTVYCSVPMFIGCALFVIALSPVNFWIMAAAGIFIAAGAFLFKIAVELGKEEYAMRNRRSTIEAAARLEEARRERSEYYKRLAAIERYQEERREKALLKENQADEAYYIALKETEAKTIAADLELLKINRMINAETTKRQKDLEKKRLEITERRERHAKTAEKLRTERPSVFPLKAPLSGTSSENSQRVLRESRVGDSLTVVYEPDGIAVISNRLGETAGFLKHRLSEELTETLGENFVLNGHIISLSFSDSGRIECMISLDSLAGNVEPPALQVES